MAQDLLNGYPWINEALAIKDNEARIEYLEQTIIDLNKKLDRYLELWLDIKQEIETCKNPGKKYQELSATYLSNDNVITETKEEITAVQNFYYEQLKLAPPMSETSRDRLLILWLLIKFKYLKAEGGIKGLSFFSNTAEQRFFIGELLDINPKSLDKPIRDIDKSFEWKDLEKKEIDQILPGIKRLKEIFNHAQYPDINVYIEERIKELVNTSSKE